MSFTNPLLLLLIPLIALQWVVLRRRNSPALRYSTLGFVRHSVGRRARIIGWGRPILRTLGMSLLLFALAGPRTPDAQTPISVEGVAIVLVLDVSASMGEPLRPGEPTSRLDAAKATFERFVIGEDELTGRSRDTIGLVSFAALPETVCPLTLNHDVTIELVGELTPQSGIDAGTNIGDALAEGLHRLDAATGQRSILILLSDGEHNTSGEALKPRQAAGLALSLDIPIYTIDCAGPPIENATPEQIEQRREGRAILETIANRTGGQAFAANTLDDLSEAYRQIDQLERQPATSFYYQKYHDHTNICIISGLIVWALLGVLNQTIWRQLP